MVSKSTRLAMTGAAISKAERRQSGSNGDGPVKQGSLMRLLFGIFPLLVIPVVLYNLLALAFGGPVQTTNEFGETVMATTAPMTRLLGETFIELPMISGVTWVLSKGDAIVLLAVLFLFLEILKSTSTGTATIINHGVSLLLFIVCLVQFLLMPNYATSVFFIVMAMTLLDVLAGVIVTIVSAGAILAWPATCKAAEVSLFLAVEFGELLLDEFHLLLHRCKSVGLIIEERIA